MKLITCGEQPEVGDAEKLAVSWLLLLKLKESRKTSMVESCLSIALVDIGIAARVFMNVG